jgi:hypothetical protein
VYGQTNSGTGVYGVVMTGGSAGVYGVTSGTGYGVWGNTTTGSGYAGAFTGPVTVSNSYAGFHGVSAIVTPAGVAALYGKNDTATGSGVYGTSSASTGVYGTSMSGYGAIGAATNGIGVYGTATTGFAGYFAGKVYVGGQLVVSDPSYKSGLLAHPDGSHRLVYCVESPESWIEDFGTEKIASGKADVSLDPDFAAVVHTDDYKVFLTPLGDSKGLYVAQQSAAGFSVREQQGGTSTLSFHWRVVARPAVAAEKKAQRLAKFEPPKPVATPKVAVVPVGAPSTSPTPPAPPKLPNRG